MRGARLSVPAASRQRALKFASTVAAGAVATSAASAAGAASLAKSFVVYLAIGTVGGGALSLAATKLVSELDQPAASVTAPAVRAPAPVEPRGVVPPALALNPTPALPVNEPTNDGISGDRSPAAEVPSGASEARRSMPTSSLFEEQRAIEQARAAISRGDTATALGLLDAYERNYARRQFGPEALALRIEALRNQGQLAAARARASEFERRYPRHPLLARVREQAR
jgi:hypothetical protein